MSVKRMNVKEFREKGYLQELNRQFLHPLGLAMEITIEEDGSERLGGIWDYRNDPEGLMYDLASSSKSRIKEFKKKATYIEKLRQQKALTRMKQLGFIIEPIEE